MLKIWFNDGKTLSNLLALLVIKHKTKIRNTGTKFEAKMHNNLNKRSQSKILCWFLHYFLNSILANPVFFFLIPNYVMFGVVVVVVVVVVT